VELKLPLSVISQVDVARLLRELNSLDDFFVGAKVRQGGTPIQPPRLTRRLEQLAAANNVNLLDEKQRQDLQPRLDAVLAQAPRLHISFATEPTPAALDKILDWLRQNIHPRCLLQVGLQPTIAAGCVLRTPNKVFDISLRSFLKQQEPYLVKLIAGAAGESR